MICQQLLCFMKQKSKRRFNERGLTDEFVSLTSIVDHKMKVIGIWRGHNHDQNHIFADVVYLILLISCISQAITLFMSRNDMQEAIHCFSILSFCFMGLLKLTSLRRNRNTWQKLLNLVRDLEQQRNREAASDVEYETDDESKDTDGNQKDYTKKIQDVASALTCFYLITAVIFVLAPFVEFALMWFRKLPTSYPHILQVWTPYEENLTTYFFVILVELIGAVYCVGGHVAFDVTSTSLMLLLSGEFSTLRVNIQRIGGKGNSCFLSKRRNLRAHERVIKCQRHHLTLFRVNHVLDSILKPIMGVYINLTTLTLCANAVQLTSPLSKVQKLSLMQYMCGCLTQLFLFCHYGDSVLHASDMGPAEGAFSCSWWALAPRTRKKLLILAIGLSRPLRLKAGWFHYLDRPAFLATLQTAYSFYTVLSKTRH